MRQRTFTIDRDSVGTNFDLYFIRLACRGPKAVLVALGGEEVEGPVIWIS